MRVRPNEHERRTAARPVGAGNRGMPLTVRRNMFKALAGGVPTMTGAVAPPAPRPQLHVVLGEPLTGTREPGVSGRVSMDRATERIRLRMAGHIAGAQTATGQDLPADDYLSSKHKGQQP